MSEMDVAQFDPPVTLDYLQAVMLIARAFPVVSSHAELEEMMGRSRITDVSHLPVFQHMSAADPLPPGYSQRVYQFVDGIRGRSILDAAFHRSKLVNVRLQLFMQGWFATSKARKCLREQLIPSISVMLGSAQETTQNHATFRNAGLVVVARHMPGTGSLSTYVMHQDYA